MIRNDYYSPDIAIHPGETLKETLDALQMTQVDLADRTGLTPKTINEIIKGKNPITSDTALKLSVVFGMSSSFWNNLQKNYEETISKLASEKILEKETSLLKNFSCYSELCVLGFVEATRDKLEKVYHLQKFFGVSSLSLVPKIHRVAFRKKTSNNFSRESLAAWLRCGELYARKIDTAEFDIKKARDSIKQLRLLTQEKAEVFSDKIIKICASFGVAVVFVPYFKNTYVNGTTQWLTPHKALIQLSARGRYDDSFWFTFFHELGHLLKHGRTEEFIDFEKGHSHGIVQKEKEADDFARNELIPKTNFSQFINEENFADSAIKNFSKNLGISPSIVAGRLAYEKNNWSRWAHLRNKIQIVPQK